MRHSICLALFLYYNWVDLNKKLFVIHTKLLYNITNLEFLKNENLTLSYFPSEESPTKLVESSMLGNLEIQNKIFS